MIKALGLSFVFSTFFAYAQNVKEYDVVVYGGSPAAISAAVQSIKAGCAVQDLPYRPLRDRLVADGQVLALKAR